MLPTLHPPTLMFATALVVGVSGLMLTLAAVPGAASRAFKLWGAAMLTGSLGLSLLAVAGMAGEAIEVAGTATILAGTALSWTAARQLAGRAAIPGMVLVGPAAFVAASIGRDSPTLVGQIIALSAGGAYTFCAAYELWRSRTERLRARDAATLLLVAHGAVACGRAASLTLAPWRPELCSPALLAAMVLEALVHTVAMALLLLAMMKEQMLRDQLEDARRLAMTDGLTGLGNRRMFDEALERAVLRAKREHRPLALLMIDADHFKRINDAYGHETGDDCLRSIAASIAQAVRRPGDVAARYGGEEFAVLLPDTDELGGEAVAAVIHAQVEQRRMEHPSNPCGRVTVSIGVAAAAAGRAASRSAHLVRAADAALYAAKALGRNRTEVASDAGAVAAQPVN